MGKYNFNGLSDAEVDNSRKIHGVNTLPPPEVETFWEKLTENFEDPLIRILCVALGITVVLAFMGYADWFEGFGIAFAVFLATFVSTYSEHKNEESFRDLQEQASRVKNHVFRSGHLKNLVVSEIVRGDYVLLQPGDKVPADGPLVAGLVHVSQASLTGEPEPLRRFPHAEKEKYRSTDLADSHTVFRGSIIEDGEGVMVVDQIGEASLYGKLMKDMNDDDSERESPLQLKLSRLADAISTVGYIGATFIFFSFLFKQFFMDQGWSLTNTYNYVLRWEVALHDTVTALILAIIIIVVAVPEGLPMMIAIVLSLNMKKLLDRNVLVRKLLGIETAGSLSVLFTDKTGTLTVGHLEVHQFVTPDCTQYINHDEIPAVLRKLLFLSLKHTTASMVDKEGKIVGGNSSDKAFLRMIPREELLREDAVERGTEILFSSARKYSATTLNGAAALVAEFPRGIFGPKNHLTIVKGAPEAILKKCTRSFTNQGQIQKLANIAELNRSVENMSHAGVRVIAIAATQTPLAESSDELPGDLAFFGFIGLRDEIRPESKHAIETCQGAGIQVVMITGDRKETAIAIARETGLLPLTVNPADEGSDRHLPRNSVITHEDIEQMGDDELAAIMNEVRVIARALPTDKSRLVRIAQSMNSVVGMTGDGVNDAAALNRADVGFAMGSGTEMAKEAADIVIMDDNIDSIVTSVLYGRTIFKSIRKFIVFQSTINVASTLIVFLGPFLGFDFPLTLIQLLWVNLVMDTLAALAFGGEPALTRYLAAPPLRRDESIVDPYMWSSFILNGTFVACLSVIFLVNDDVSAMFVRDTAEGSLNAFFTAFFCFFIFICVINAFNVRTRSINLLDSLVRNPGFLIVMVVIFFVQMVMTAYGGKVLRTVPLYTHEWTWILVASLIILPYDILRKLVIAPWLPNSIEDRTGLDEEEESGEEMGVAKDD